MSSSSSAVLILLLLGSAAGFTAAARGGAMLSSVPSTMIPLFPDSQEYATMKRPFLRKETRAFGAKQLRNCMPKGSPHTSAPSRYVNYEPLGSSARCSAPSPTRP
ncbi:hypothetical protein EUGRSUZ_J00896 [Eucalyptus grandis]|uniref:Uncharacterized protein n=3 Tax=Eucalyptus TaxID=3932 RepID=A0ACC3J5F9_EUCGR|nr:hypothetical protein EUGRSUZ_J00896 [Eucalyptus grandis]